MSSPSDAAPDRSSAAGEETKRRLSRKRVTVITATALSLLEACGLEPSPARSEKTAGKGKKATQGEPPAEKASADGLEERQAAGSASSRERNGGRKKKSAPDRAPREAADAVPQEDASQGVAATKAALPEIPPVIPPADTAAATVPPGPCHSSEKDDCPASSCERHEGRAGDRYRGSSRYRAGSRVRVCRTRGLTTGSEAFCWSVRCGGSSIRTGRGSASLRRTAESRLPCRACPHFRWARPQEGCCDRFRIRGGSRSDHSAGTGTTACGTSHGCGGTGCRSGSSGCGIRPVVIGRRSGGAARGRRLG